MKWDEIKKAYLDKFREVLDYIDFSEFKNITLASEDSLSRDWFKPEEDEAWQDL